jgi:hypothetical protein
MAEDGKVSLELLRAQLAQAQSSPLKSGGGGGTFDDMETRVKRLEDDGKELRSDLKSILRDLSELKGRIYAMPTTWQMVGFVVALILAIYGFTRLNGTH